MVTKLHLAGVVDFDWDRVTRNIRVVRSGKSCLRVSAKTGEETAGAWVP